MYDLNTLGRINTNVTNDANCPTIYGAIILVKDKTTNAHVKYADWFGYSYDAHGDGGSFTIGTSDFAI